MAAASGSGLTRQGAWATVNEADTILIEGENCWRKRTAGRVAFLLDGAAYFAAFAAAAKRARQSILIIGWDIDSRIPLLRGSSEEMAGSRLGEFLNRLVAATPGLHVHILVWDFAMIYAFEREPLPVFKLGWKTHRRIHFRLDGNHPLGGCHHQKIVVIDDKLAFVGGFDLAQRRWDTAEHAPEEPGRVDPAGHAYPPFHDMQLMVDGEAAVALAELCRKRWWNATRELLAVPSLGSHDPWPAAVAPDLTEVRVAIARTEPRYKGRKEVREVESLYLAAVRSARHWIYLENQYFTSALVAEALASRLAEPEGPEVVLVLPRRSSGWLEESTMDALRVRLVQLLRQADAHDRLRVYYPVMPSAGEQSITVHSKLLVVDDRLLRVGSSNLSNRSMGLDTECDLAIEAGADNRVRGRIAWLRDRLLGEHLGVAPEEVGRGGTENRSLVKTVESLRGRDRSLAAFDHETGASDETPLPARVFADPEQPIEVERLIEQFVPHEVRRSGSYRLRNVAVFLLVMFGLAALWRWSPLAGWFNAEGIAHWAMALRDNPAALLIVMAAYSVASLAVFPVTLLIAVTALVFAPLPSVIYAYGGCLVSGLITYGLGRHLGRETVRRLAGGRVNRLSKRLARRGLLTVAVVRLLPIAPYTVVNMVAGASHIRLRDFLLGTLLGMSPGILAITVFAGRVANVLRHPRLENFLLLAGVIVVGVGAIVVIERRLARTIDAEDDKALTSGRESK